MLRGSGWDAHRVVGAVVGGALLLLGFAELAVRLDEPAPLLFWLPTLWGGGSLILLGVFGSRRHPQRLPWFVVVGAMLGFIPTAWTVVLPLLSVALVMMTFRRVAAEKAALGSAAGTTPEHS